MRMNEAGRLSTVKMVIGNCSLIRDRSTAPYSSSAVKHPRNITLQTWSTYESRY